MALRLRPFVAIPKDLREWTRWMRETALEGVVGPANIEDSAVTLSKHADIATDRLLGRSTTGTGPVELVTCTTAGRNLIDDADSTAQRTTLGLGTAATQNTGTSGTTVPLLDGANTHASVQATLFAVGSASPVGTQAANPDTSGASLGDLEAEVNQLKAVMRSFGMIDT